MVARNGLTAQVLPGIFTAAGAVQARSHLATGNITFRARCPMLPSLNLGFEPVSPVVIGDQSLSS
jgi:uncharacterized protein (DUF1697 family)